MSSSTLGQDMKNCIVSAKSKVMLPPESKLGWIPTPAVQISSDSDPGVGVEHGVGLRASFKI